MNQSSGSSKIELDARLLNSLLAIFVNKPGGLQLQVSEQGQLQGQQGDLKVALDPVTLAQNLRLHLQNGSLGPFVVQVQQVQLNAQGLSLSFQLQQ
jgi:hypothetical protein